MFWRPKKLHDPLSCSREIDIGPYLDPVGSGLSPIPLGHENDGVIKHRRGYWGLSPHQTNQVSPFPPLVGIGPVLIAK